MMYKYWEQQIIDCLNSGKKVVIEYGCLNDEIVSYLVDREGTISGEVGAIVFRTSGCAFPKAVWFTEDTKLYLNEAYGSLFVELLEK